MKKLIMSAAVLAMIGGGITSCKKGHQDPGISFRGRDARVTGIWNLSEVEADETFNETVNTTNDVNNDEYTVVTNRTSAWTFDGSSFSMNTNQTELHTYSPDGDNPADGYDDSHPRGTSPSSANAMAINGGSYSETANYNVEEMTLTLYKDHTYAISYSYTLSGGEDTQTYYDTNDDTKTTESDDKVSGQKTVYSNSYQGEWMWNEKDTKEKKTEVLFQGVSSGSVSQGVWLGLGTFFQGHLIRLANKEIIIERTVNETDDETDVNEGTFYDYGNSTSEEGKETTVTTSTTTMNWKEVWEKADDSESKRHKAEESGSDE